MIIFLSGPDDYRRLQKKRDLITEFRKKRSELGLGFFDAATKDWRDEFDAFAGSSSLFDAVKLAVLDNLFEEMEAKPLAAFLKPFLEDKSITLLIAERDKPVKALAFLLEKPAFFQKFENLEGVEWLGWIAAEAKKLGVMLAPTAAQFLATVYSGNSWALATELQKLAAWRATGASAGKPISRQDLDAFDLEAAPNYWMLLNGLKSFDARVRLTTLEQLFAMNDPAAKIFNILAAQWKEKTPQMAEFDFAVKSGKLEYEEALVDLML